MKDKYTTIRVKISTRDRVNKMAVDKSISIDDLITLLMKDTTRQILLNVDRDKYQALEDLTSVLHKMGIIKQQSTEAAAMLAIEKLMEGMEKTLQGTVTNNPQTTHTTRDPTFQTTQNTTTTSQGGVQGR